MSLCRPYDLPLRVPYEWAGGRQGRRRGVLVRLEAQGQAGFGEVAPAPDRPIDATSIDTELRRLVKGLDPEDMDFLAQLDQRGPPRRIRCALSTAWWDLCARLDGRSMGQALAKTLAWPRRPSAFVPCNALIPGSGSGEAHAAASHAWADGFQTLKVKLTGDADRDERRVRAVRDAAPEATIRLDANGALVPEVAKERLERLAPYDIEYIEQPVPPRDVHALRRLTAAGIIPIAIDESATDAATVDALLADGIGDVAIVKPQRVGGPDRALACVQAAMRHGKQAVVTNSLETSIGVHAALHVASLLPDPASACGLATSRFLGEDVAPPPVMDGHRMRVPDAPGLGVEAAWT